MKLITMNENASEGGAIQIIEAKKGLPLTPLELLVLAVVATVMMLSGQNGIIFSIIILVFVFIGISRATNTTTLTFGKTSLEYRIGNTLMTIRWVDITQAKIEGNKLIGKSIRIKGNAAISVNLRKPIQRQEFVITDSFNIELEEILSSICEQAKV